MDTRTWVSYGTVTEDTPEQRSVRFVDESDNPIPEGPLISVELHPSGVPVVCRVASQCAGVGESEWHPFIQGDEVLVALPEGNTHAGCMIIGRGNNALDSFPLVVAGQEVKSNTFGFKRIRTPFIVETAASYLIRSAVTGAQFGIDQTGQVIFNDGDGSRFFMGADAVGFSTSDGSTSLQALVEAQQLAMTAGSTTSFLLDKSSSQFTTTGTLSLGTTGNLSMQHAVSLEQVVNLFINFVYFLKSAGVTGLDGPTGPLFAATFPLNFNTLLATWLGPAGAGGPSTPTPATGGGNFGPLAPVLAIITAALANPLPGADPTGLTPGIGRPGLMI